jgi:uncharacterized protein
MGNLFDELKKAKLVDEKRAKKLAHEQRVERKQKGGDKALDQEAQARQAEFEKKRKDEALENRRAERGRQEQQRKKELHAELIQLVASRALGRDAEGRQHWHFEVEGGNLPFLPVNATAAKRLEAGELAIVRDPSRSYPCYVLVTRDIALRLKREFKGSVRFLNGD